MSERSSRLKKRLQIDRIGTLAAMIIVFIFAIAHIVCFARFGDSIYVSKSVLCIVGTVSFFLLYLILKHIEVTGRPFDEKIIKLMRVIAFTLIIGGFIAPCGVFVADVIKYSKAEYLFNGFDLIIPVIGIIVGIISEIFVYGKDLQEDNDLIA